MDQKGGQMGNHIFIPERSEGYYTSISKIYSRNGKMSMQPSPYKIKECHLSVSISIYTISS